MADTAKLNNMLDNLISGNAEQAQVDFHEYLRGKMSEVLGKDVTTNNQDKEEE